MVMPRHPTNHAHARSFHCEPGFAFLRYPILETAAMSIGKVTRHRILNVFAQWPSARTYHAWLTPLLHVMLLTAGSAVNVATAQTSSYKVLDHYSEHHYRITMRDGARLFTTVFTPKVQTSPLPILLQRSPYMCVYTHVPPAFLAKAAYIFVYQDARGTCRSGGTFLELSPSRSRRPGKAAVDESTDADDTIQWLLSQVPDNNGNVGLWGASYEGFYTQASIANSPPAVKAADIEAMGDWNYHHGAFMLGDNFEFYIDYQPKGLPDAAHLRYWTRDAYAFFLTAGSLDQLTSQYFDRESSPNPSWADLLKHDTLDGYWKERDLLSHLKDIHCAVLNVGSWFDQYVPGGPVSYYHAIREQDRGVTDLLVMGAWSHAADISPGNPDFSGRQLGDIDFGSDTAAEYRRKILLPFFEHYLKGKPARLPSVFAFDTGLHAWRTYPKWPPPDAVTRTLYLRAKGALSFDPPDTVMAFDQYVSDPAKPVPIMGFVPSPGRQLMQPQYMTADERFAARRPDVLVYETKPLTEDVTVVGPVTPMLFVSTTGTDSDWDVKLIDVYPSNYSRPETSSAPGPRVDLGGYELLVRGEPMRGKFRHGWDKPERFAPGRIAKVTYTMAGVYHTFRKGHRLMVQIQSSMFPLADLNPQTFVDIPTAKPRDFRKATERVYRSRDTDSGVLIHILPTWNATRDVE